ncbi:MAG: hypothetical protein ACTS27_11540 [Phycisphaerales bacterium]
MIRAVAFAVPFAIAAPVIAGIPVNSSGGSASSAARVNADAASDTAALNSPLDSIETDAYRDLLVGGQLRGRGIAESSLTVMQFAPRRWTTRSFMTTNAFSNDGNEAFAETGADYWAEFTVGAGRFARFSGSLLGGYAADEQSILEIEYAARLYRDGVLQHETLLSGRGSFTFNAQVEDVGAVYRAEFMMLVTTETAGVAGAMSSTSEIDGGITVDIIPAPVSAAPFALAGVFAARRRRA